MPISNKKLFDKYLQKMKTLNRVKANEDIFDALLNGKNTYLRMTHSESSHFDPTWIEVIENCLYDLGEIINNPRTVTKQDSSIVPVELARKIDGESVQHLASHTQYIKDIDENGDVVPSKILAHYNEDNLFTYENRFIATFIRRLVLFIEKRYSFIKNQISLFTDDILLMKNSSYVNGQEIEIETKIKIKKESDDEVSIAAKGYIERIQKMREYILYYYASPFMKKMKNERDVRKPILQTNIIRKNPKYRKCYETFLFIEKFSDLGVSYKVNENYQLFNEEERKNLNYLNLSSYLAMNDDKEYGEVKTNNKVYKPKIKTSIDDEEFTYGQILKGPIEFVRVDEPYRAFLSSKVKKDLPEHPTKYERMFYEDEYKYKKDEKELSKETDKLLSRKEKQAVKYEKEIERIIALRDAEERELLRLKEETRRLQEEQRIELQRQRIIAAAKQEPEPIYEEPVLEETKPAVNEEEILPTNNEPLEEAPMVEENNPVQEETKEEAPIIEEQPVNNEIQTEEEPVSEELSNKEQIEENPVEEVIEPEPIVEEPTLEVEEQPVIEEVPTSNETIEEPIIEENNVESSDINDEIKEEIPPTIEEVQVLDDVEPAEEEPLIIEETPVISNEEELPEVPQEETKSINEEPTLKEEDIPQIVDENVNEEPAAEDIPEPIEEKSRIDKVAEKAEQVINDVAEKVTTKVNKHKEKAVKQIEKAKSKAKAKSASKKVNKPVKADEGVSSLSSNKANKPVEIEKPAESPTILAVIPGRFIVKANEGYYINDHKFSKNKSDAFIFDDFNKARQIKNIHGGKVIKL